MISRLWSRLHNAQYITQLPVLPLHDAIIYAIKIIVQ